MNQIDRPLRHSQRHVFVENFTSNDRFQQLRHPEAWLTSARRYRFSKSFNNRLTTPNALMRFVRKFKWQCYILHGPHFAGQFVAFVFARSWYVMDRCLWQSTFLEKFPILGRQQCTQAALKRGAKLESIQLIRSLLQIANLG